ncbi:hypothetical protein GCM10022254_66490 [Actinomadura meridiana]|uniref:Uncharacterized protein n=2 Tax=Actinomadura meridiana TaxID=559626 RepID=A0ABP8CLA5_9ACTN
MNKPAWSWTAACPGSSSMPSVYATSSEPRPRDTRGSNVRGTALRGNDLRELLLEQQRIQDQGRSVFDHLLEDATVPAPATTHVGVTDTGDESGPYPWRPPV